MKTIILPKRNTQNVIRILVIFSITVLSSCSKKAATLPVLATNNVTGITRNAAVSGGNITDDGGESITSKGICWSTSASPTTSDNKTEKGTGAGSFIADLSGLTPNTLYYVRAYATNSVGTSYGNEVTFTTPQTSVASLTTDTVSMITSTAGMSGGNITSDGGQSVTIRGLCWSTTQNPTISDDTTKNGSGTGIFSGDLISLTPNTNYFVRSYAINSVGTAYGNQVTFKTDVAGPGANEVFIQGMAFNPVTITVSAGTTITWTNKDGVSHTVTSDTALFDSGTIASNGTYSHTFSIAGTFAYHCSIHTDMMATVVVN